MVVDAGDHLSNRKRLRGRRVRLQRVEQRPTGAHFQLVAELVQGDDGRCLLRVAHVDLALGLILGCRLGPEQRARADDLVIRLEREPWPLDRSERDQLHVDEENLALVLVTV